MNLRRPSRTVALLAVAPLVAAPALVLAGTTAEAAERERRASCAGAVIKIEAEHDDGRIDVNADVDSAVRGERWRFVLKQDGARYANSVQRIDDDGDADLDRTRTDRRGTDVFAFTATRLATGKSCTVKVTL